MRKHVDVLKCELLGMYLFIVGFLMLYIALYTIPLTPCLIAIVINCAWAFYWGDYYCAISNTKKGENKIIFFNKCLLVSFVCGWILYGCYYASLVYCERINKWVNKE